MLRNNNVNECSLYKSNLDYSVQDENLTAYNVIILDEAHERTVQTDVLFGIVKKAQTNRIFGHFHPLKVKILFQICVCGDLILYLLL